MPFQIIKKSEQDQAGLPGQEQQPNISNWQELQAALKSTPQQPAQYTPSGNPLEELLRFGGRTATRGLEAIAGLPGDIVQLGGSLANVAQRQVTGKDIPTLQDIPYLPTSQRIRENITTPLAEKVAGKGVLEPQSKVEQFTDEMMGDIATLAMPIKGKIPFGRALATAGLGNVAKYAADAFNVPEWGQEAIKLGTMITYNLAGPKRFKEFATKRFNDAEALLPKAANVTAEAAKPVIEDLKTLSKKKAFSSDVQARVANFIEESTKKVGKKSIPKDIPVRDLWDISKDLNNEYYSGKGSAFLERSYPDIKPKIMDTFAEYGKENPKFYNAFTEANSVYGSLSKAKNMTEKLDKIISPAKLGVATLGALGGFYSPTKLVTVVGPALAASHAAKTLRVLHESPAARKYFKATMKAAAANNTRQANKFAQKLDNVFTKEGINPPPSRYRIIRAG